MTKIAILLASEPTLPLADGTTQPCGFWAEELVGPWRLFTEHDAEVIVCTPDGAPAPVEQASLQPDTASLTQAECDELRAFLDTQAETLSAPHTADSAEARAVDAVYVPGGYAPLAQLHEHPAVATLLSALHQAKAPIAAVCHGSAALLAVEDSPWPFAGVAVTGFSDEEEKTVAMADKLVWTLEKALTERGGDYRGAQPWSEHVLDTPGLITGQNPASAMGVARALIGQLPQGVTAGIEGVATS